MPPCLKSSVKERFDDCETFLKLCGWQWNNEAIEKTKGRVLPLPKIGKFCFRHTDEELHLKRSLMDSA